MHGATIKPEDVDWIHPAPEKIRYAVKRRKYLDELQFSGETSPLCEIIDRIYI
jgi:hypothetical protein